MSSELPLKADIARYSRHVSRVPTADQATFDAVWRCGHYTHPYVSGSGV